jgi:drug/metabolite transporter (DMT)-like permease
MKTAILIAVIVLADAAGDVLLTRGMKQVGEVSTASPRVLLSMARQALTNRSFISGILFFAVTFFSFLTILSWADLSLVFPATSLVYVVSTLGAKFVLKETVSFQRWAGIFLVCLGVALTSLP